MKYKNESQFTSDLLKALKKIPGVKAFRLNTGRRGGVTFGEVGAPDIVVIVRGKFVGVETKFGKGNLSDDQAVWHYEAVQAGAEMLTAWPDDFGLVIQTIIGMSREF